VNKENEEKALKLHKKSIVIDGLELFFPVGDVGYFDKLVQVGVTAAHVTVFETDDTPLQAMQRLNSWYDIFEKHSDKVMLVSTGRDIEKAKREGKFGVIMGSQNADILGGSLSLLSVYKRLGVRIIQLNYYEQNLLGEGFNERTDSGLSNFGVEVVKEMNRLGLVIDVSHCGDQVTMDAINYSKDPVMITHANARALCPHKRNKTDEQIKALAEKDGVIGLNAYSIFCEVRKDIRPTLEDLLDMADYIVRLVGPDYVSLGLDLSFRTKESYMQWEQLYPNLVPKWGMFGRNIFQTDDGTVDVTLFPEITKGLVARGYSDDDIEKILGLNFLRVFKEVCG